MKTIIYKKAGKEVRLEKDWSFERIEKVICRAGIKECEIINGKFKIRIWR